MSAGALLSRLSVEPANLLPAIPWATWRPKLFEMLARYDRRTLAAAVVAGLTVGVAALPLAMAFRIASGVTPQAGVYTGIVGELIEHVGAKNIVPNIQTAIERVREIREGFSGIGEDSARDLVRVSL